MKTHWICRLVASVGAIFLLLATPGLAVVIDVNSTLDVLADDGLCTLREAVIASNTDTPSGAQPGECIAGSGSDVIVLQAATYTLTISGTGEDLGFTGDLDILDSVDILGADQTVTVVDGNDLDRVFEIDSFADISVSIADLTIRDGATAADGGGVYSDEVLDLARISLISNSSGNEGGAIYSQGDLSITDCLIVDNTAGDSGGGFVSEGLSSLVRSMVSSNTSGSRGGGFFNGGALNVSDSTIAFNTAEDGGGIFSDLAATLNLTKSTVMDNIASVDGGGVWAYGDATIDNSTISGNQAVGSGGGTTNWTTTSLDIRNSTFADNSAAQGSAINNLGATFVSNTVIAGGCAESALLSLDGNIESPGDTCGLAQASDQVLVSAADLNLGPLAHNGGITVTHAPIFPSVAIETGVAGTCLNTDQRGVPRPQDGDDDGIAECDVGSVERAGMLPTIFSDGFESGDTSAWSSTQP